MNLFLPLLGRADHRPILMTTKDKPYTFEDRSTMASECRMYTIDLIEETWNETPKNLKTPAYCFNRRLVLVAVAIQQRLKALTEDSFKRRRKFHYKTSRKYVNGKKRKIGTSN